MHHQLNHADLDHDDARLGQSFIVLAVSAKPPQPSQRSFHHPAFRQQDETATAFGTAHHLDRESAVRRQSLFQVIIVVFIVRPQQRQSGKSFAS